MPFDWVNGPFVSIKLVSETHVLTFMVLSNAWPALWLDTLATLKCGICVSNLSFYLLQVGIH